MTLPPSPPITPKTTARCQIFNSAKAEIINSNGKRWEHQELNSDCLIRYLSTLPPTKAATVPRIVEMPTPSVALRSPKTKATWLPSIICENTSLPSESVLEYVFLMEVRAEDKLRTYHQLQHPVLGITFFSELHLFLFRHWHRIHYYKLVLGL